MDAARERLAAAGCSVLVATQARPEILAMYERRQVWTVPLACDPERALYRAFGLGRASWLTFFRPKVLVGYLAKILRGHGVRLPYEGEDVLQLGGDFILNRHRRVVFAHPSADPTDRPSVSAILAALQLAGPIHPESSRDDPFVDFSPRPN